MQLAEWLKLHGKEKFTVLSEIGSLEEGATTIFIEVLRQGILRDRDLEITGGMLQDMVRNFKENAYGTELQLDYGHDRGGEAAGWFQDLFVKETSLMAAIELTEPACDKIRKKLWKFVSSEIAWTYPHHETGDPVSNVLIGAGLTNIPALKGQKPIQLSEEENLLIHSTDMYKKYIADLKARPKLSEADIAFARNLAESLSADEQTAAKQEIDALDEKRKAQEKKDAEQLAQSQQGHVSVDEFNQLKKDKDELAEKVERRDLAEVVGSTLVVAPGRTTGFRDESKHEVVDFMLKLSKDLRTQFTALMAKVVHVDLSTRGDNTVTPTTAMSEDFEDQLCKLSDELLASGKAKDVDEAQKMAYKQLKEKKA